jgi:Zn-dependent metalloprotease
VKKLLGFMGLAFLAGSTFFMITGSVGASKPIFGQGDDDPAVAKQISLGILRERAAQRAIGNVDEFQVQNVAVDELKMAHTRVRQTVEGVPVWEGEAIVHLKSDGSLATVTDDLKDGDQRQYETESDAKAGRRTR